MQRLMLKYRGVILLFLVLVVMTSMLNARVKELNAIGYTNTVTYYEK